MSEDEVQQVIQEIKNEVKSINISQISFRNLGYLYSAIARSTNSMNRYNELAQAFEKYAEEETNPSKKSKYEAIAQHYRDLANKSKESISKNNFKLQYAQAQISLLKESKEKVLSQTDALDMLKSVRDLINNLSAMNYNVSRLTELAQKLEALLSQPFTIILEYEVSW